MRPLPLALCTVAVLSLAACATPASEADSASDAPPAMADTPAPAESPETPAMQCDAAKVQWTLGQMADEALVAKAKADSGSDRLRVIKPGMAVTMDYREDRLNLDVDADGKVTAARCG